MLMQTDRMKGNFLQLIGGDIPVLIDFFAEWCGPCKAQAPVISDVAKTLSGRVRVVKIDIDRNPEIAARYRITAVPTLALFRRGEMLWSRAGMMSKQQILAAVQNTTS